MNYGRWLIVGYLLVLMVFTTTVLLKPGERGYKTLTTSDSGWNFGIAREMDSANGLVDRYSLSHAPYGNPLGTSDVGQPLLLVMLYRGLHALDPDLSLMDAARYWSPLLFALALIPIFLIGKELAGNWAGCAAAFFASTLTGSIYWTKIGAFDREALQLVLTVWLIYLAVKTFKTSGRETLKFGFLGGLIFGIFGLSWGGYLIFATVLVLWLILAILSTWLRYLAPMFLIGMLIAIYSGKIIYMLYALVGSVILAAVAEAFVRRRVSPVTLARGILSAFRTHSLLIGSVATTFAVLTATLVFLGGASPRLWEGFVSRQLRYVGIGEVAEEVSFARYAGEMSPMDAWGIRDTVDPQDTLRITGGSFFFVKGATGEITGRFYNSASIQWIVLIFTGLGLLKVCWSRKKWELISLAWLFVLLGLVWPWLGQVRFDRQWWPFVAVMAGVGVGALVSALKRLSQEPLFAEWLAPVQKPLPLAFSASIIAVLLISNASPISFVSNAYATAERTTPPTEWHGIVGLDEGFIETFEWLRGHTPEDSVVAIEWSFGHLLTGVSERSSVTDGAETASGEVGKWEYNPIQHPTRPPDYVYRKVGGEGIFLERFVPREAPPLGRRSDMQWIFAMDNEELADLLNLYWNDYNTRIDYLVFHIATPWTLEDAASRPRLGDIEAVTNRITEPVRGVFVFGFDGENVIFDGRTGEVRRNGDNLIGYILGEEKRDENGNIFHLYAGHSFPHLRDATVWKTLLIYYQRRDGRIWLTGGALCRGPARPPIGTLIYLEMLGTADYLETVYKSSNGLVKVVKVKHVPTLIFPDENAVINNNMPTFRWSNTIGAARYELWLDNDADFSSPEILESVSGVTYKPSMVLADGSYLWRVRTFRADNTELGWSPTRTFTIDTTPPAAPTLHAPEKGVTISVTPTFEWTLGAGATEHRLLVDNDPDFSSPEVEIALKVPENTHVPGELAAGSYWWKVIALDDANNQNQSPAWEFTLLG